LPQVEQLPPEQDPQLSEPEEQPKLEMLVICLERLPPHFTRGHLRVNLQKKALFITAIFTDKPV